MKWILSSIRTLLLLIGFSALLWVSAKAQISKEEFEKKTKDELANYDFKNIKTDLLETFPT